ncbi:MAG: DUF4350 domain-containing protein [Verrucomicrobiota bacterium]
MKLENISAVLRPRSNQEAADLGLALVRRHAAGIFKAWLTLLLPLWGLLILLLHDYPSVTVFVVWWLKPLYDRVVLFYLGRALFGDAPPLRTQLRAWPRLLTRNLSSALLWRRMSSARSFVMPVMLLENLTGQSARGRTSILKRHGGGAAASLTTMAGMLEGAVWLALIFGISSFLPEEYTDPLTTGSLLSNYSAIPPGLLWSVAGCYLAAVALIEPFYAGAGFGLYINARTHLEGWDVEVAFRRLGERLRTRGGKQNAAPAAVPPPLPPKAGGADPLPIPIPPPGSVPPLPHFPPPLPASKSPAPPAGTGPGAPQSFSRNLPLLLLAAGAWLALAGPVAAAPAVEVDLREARQEIKEVMAHPDFIRHVEKYQTWVPDPSTASTPPSPPDYTRGWDWSWLNFSWLAAFFRGDWLEVTLRLLLVTATLALLVWVGFLIFKNRQRLFGGSGGERTKFRGPRTVMGLEVAPDSLPEDIPAEAWAAWSRGESAGAVRLLYRGALAWLMQRAALPIRESDTEGDCLRHAATLEDAARSGYFAVLTSAWQGTAYGSLKPGAEAMRDLCARWPFSLTEENTAATSSRTGNSGPEGGSGSDSGSGARPASASGANPGSSSGSAPASGRFSRSMPATLLALAAVFMLTGCGRFVEKERELGHQGEARRDPWLAAGRFLRMHDYHVDSRRGFLDLPHQSTLLITPSDAITSEALANIALRWAQDGGHLVYLAHGGSSRRGDWENFSGFGRSQDADTTAQPMLTALGISLDSLGGTSKAASMDIGGEPYRISLGEEVTLNTLKARYPVDLIAGSDNAAALASLRCGQGRVTVLANAHPFRNRFIEDDDNAALLLAMAQLEPHVSAVRFIKAGRVNLWDMLAEHAWMALTGMGVLLLVWLWRYLPRFGPVRALPVRSQRRFAIHLEEAGHFFWKHRLSDILLEAPRQAVLAAARRRALKETERHFIPLLAARCGLPDERVDQALNGGETRDARVLTQRMADLQTLLQSL